MCIYKGVGRDGRGCGADFRFFSCSGKGVYVGDNMTSSVQGCMLTNGQVGSAYPGTRSVGTRGKVVAW